MLFGDEKRRGKSMLAGAVGVVAKPLVSRKRIQMPRGRFNPFLARRVNSALPHKCGSESHGCYVFACVAFSVMN